MAAVPPIGGEVGADISIPAIGFGLAEGGAAYVAENPVTTRKIESASAVFFTLSPEFECFLRNVFIIKYVSYFGWNMGNSFLGTYLCAYLAS